jgi:hypothetical protein
MKEHKIVCERCGNKEDLNPSSINTMHFPIKNIQYDNPLNWDWVKHNGNKDLCPKCSKELFELIDKFLTELKNERKDEN